MWKYALRRRSNSTGFPRLVGGTNVYGIKIVLLSKQTVTCVCLLQVLLFTDCELSRDFTWSVPNPRRIYVVPMKNYCSN